MGGKLDVVLLQETRATQHWAQQLSALYARAWGYDPQRLQRPLSFWPATPVAAGGVAILLHPDSAITEVVPWQQESWSSHFVAIQGIFDGEPITVVCIYAPIAKKPRETLFMELAQLPAPTGKVLMGGDFNCFLDSELDRSRRTRSTPSAALGLLLEAWSLVDAVLDDMLAAATPHDIAAFHSAYHSYMYPVRGDAIATARLDRWYVTSAAYGQVGSVVTTPPAAHSDHDSVSIEVYARESQPCSRGCKSPQLRYPLPVCAVEAISARSRSMLTAGSATFPALAPQASADAWDALKLDVRRQCLLVRRERMAAATACHKTRVRRLRRALETARLTASSPIRADGRPTVDSVTKRLAALALDPAARYRSIRRTLIALQLSRAMWTGLRRHASHAGRPHESARAFYRRISVKFSRRAAHSLPPLPGSDLGVADRVARDWRPITQKPPVDQELQERFFAQLPPKPERPDLSDVDAPFTEAEVARAIAACPRGKACGPDGLGNDWYRDHADTLAPILAALFTQWHSGGVVPASFVQASVYCIPKSARPTSGLDFRPIALLNTDYKIYARVLLQRVRAAVPRLVARTQYGFVPGRQVHDPIDVWSALQSLASTGTVPPHAIAILLDFAKAYDSLDRHFLALALARHGFSSTLVRAVELMHLGTTAAYIADGQTSATEAVWNGIRQGCPFAPTLFILAVDTLYEMVRADPRLPGLQLNADVAVSIVGFADDTKVYVSSTREAHDLLDVLDSFTAASGLAVNQSKCVAVRLTATGDHGAVDFAGFPLAAVDQLVRYLGAQISTLPRPGQVWDVVIQQLRARLHLAEIKTSDLLQRVQVCQAVILPKVLYVARHSWPSSSNIKRLQRFLHNYAWHGRLADDGVHRRAWMSATTAAARREDGGLQLPCLRTELLLMSATTVRRWLSAQDPVAAAVSSVLLRHVSAASHGPVAPARGPAPAPRICSTLAASGTSVLRAAACRPRDSDETELVQRLLAHAGRTSLSEGSWVDGWYCRDFTRHGQTLDVIARHQRQRYGRLNIASMLATPILGHGLLLHGTGRDLTAADLPGLACSKARVGDLIEMQWARQKLARFRLRAGVYPYPEANSFRLLCDLLVMQYPDLLSAHEQPDVLVERSKSGDRWSLTQEPDAVHLRRHVDSHDPEDLGAVVSLPHAQAVARRATGRRRVHFAPHPLLCSSLPLWGSTELYANRRLRALVAGATAVRASTELEARFQRLSAQSTDFADALASVSWAEVHNLPHSASRQRLLFLKVKGDRVSGWDVSNGRRGCPHCASSGPRGGDVYHIVWECPAAQRLWSIVRSWWSRLGLWSVNTAAHEREFFTAIFGLRLPRTPPRVWDMASLSQRPRTEDAPEGPYPALQAAWQQVALETLVVILSWRHSRFDPDRAWPAAKAVAYHAASCQRVLNTLAFRCSSNARIPAMHAPLIRELRGLFDQPERHDVLPPPPTHDATHVLFFDGGSRGNPGSGGSGACVVRVDAVSGEPAIVWSAAMSHAHRSTTNNQAEYRGLITGLRAARHFQWPQLEVVGDSALILRQLRDYKPPKNPRLLELYSQARRLADQIGVRHWTHHVRAHNKMADSLANLAMDCRASSQVQHPSARSGHCGLSAHLSNDIRPWLADAVSRHGTLSVAF